MDEDIKIFAPKPVKASSNFKGVKIKFGDFEKMSTPAQCHTPQLGSDSGRYKRMKFTRVKEENKRIDLSANDLNGLNFDLGEDAFFEKTVQNDFSKIKSDDDSVSKSEILSILRSDSTNFESVYGSVNLFNDNEEEDYFVFDECRTSMPPIRSGNPFYKNFDKEIPVEDEDFDFVGIESYDPK